MWSGKSVGDYQAVKAALALLSPTPPDAVAAAAALNAQTDPLDAEPAKIVEVTTFLRNAARADGTTAWLSIVAAAAAGNVAAKAALDYNNDPRTQTINLASPVVVGMLGALVASGVITQAESDGVLAVVPTTSLRWQPALTDQDILAAEALS